MACIQKGGGGLHRRLTVGAVLLAAGTASRMGGRPKCLLELGGVPLIRRQLFALSVAGVDEVIVVLGHAAERIEPMVQSFPVTLVRNPRPEDGQVSSLRLGLAALGGELDAMLVALADQPLISAQDIGELIGAYKKRPEGTAVVVPTVDGLPGNPVIFAAEVKDDLLAGDMNLGCKQWQAAHPERVHRWATANNRYRVDVDTPEDIEALAARTGHRLIWPASLEPSA